MTSYFQDYPNLQYFLQVRELQIPKTQNSEFIDHLFSKINYHIGNGGRVLVLSLTKKSSEEINNFFLSKGYKSYYLHSEVDTIDRWDIIKKLKSGEIDILVGVNLLREGIDLPEVTMIAILDADKEGFLRSTTSLIQIVGRAARNPNSEVILYAEQFTGSMLKALNETYRRRKIQQEYNEKHGIDPEKAVSNVKELETVKTDDQLQFVSRADNDKKKLKKMTKKEKDIMVKDLRSQLDQAINNWEFEKAANIRDQLKEIQGD